MIESYQSALDFVYSRLNFERMSSTEYNSHDFKLARMQQILAMLGNPQQRLKTFHVAGTKGKGSTCHWLSHLLIQLGMKVGLFTSPHLDKYEERFTINGELIQPNEFIDLLNQLINTVLTRGESIEILNQTTFFELTTALAWLHFQNKKVDYVVLEVGMGGLYDTTNICNPIATAITSIDYDHMRVLGATIEEIATQKAGIIKSNVPVICAAVHPIAIAVVNQTALACLSTCWNLGNDFFWNKSDDQNNNPRSYNITIGDTLFQNVALKMHGLHQADNLATAMAMIHMGRPELFKKLMTSHDSFLCSLKNNLDETSTSKLYDLTIPLRIEIASRNPVVILDAAHNPLSIRTLLQTLNDDYTGRKIWLIFGCSRDKDIESMVKQLTDSTCELILTQYLSNPRNLSSKELLQICEHHSQRNFAAFDSPVEAYNHVRQLAKDDDVICVTGSFFLAAELRNVILNKQ